MTISQPAATGAVDFEQLIMTWSRRNLERVPGFAVAAHSTHWPTEVGRRFEDFGSVGRFLRQGWTRTAALGHELPVCVFWGQWRDTGWYVYGCKRDSGRDGEGRPGNYLVHLLATRQPDVALRSRVAAWDAPFVAQFDESLAASRDLPALRVFFDVLDVPIPPHQVPDAERILAACYSALVRGEQIALVSSTDTTRREFLKWLAAVLPLQQLDDAAVSTFESDLSRRDLDLIFLDRAYSDLTRHEPGLLIDLDNPHASTGLNHTSPEAQRIATTLIATFPAQADAGTFADIPDLLAYLTAVDAVGSLRRLQDDQIPGVLAMAARGRLPISGGRARETLMRVVSSDELATSVGDTLISLISDGHLSLEPGLDWSFVEEVIAAGAVGGMPRWRVAASFAHCLGVGPDMAGLLLRAARRRLVDLDMMPPQRVLGALTPALYELDQADFELLASHRELYAHLLAEEDFALAALTSTANAGLIRSTEFHQAATQHPVLAAQVLSELLAQGGDPMVAISAAVDLEPPTAAAVIEHLPLGFGVVADYLELPQTPPEVAFGIVRELWPDRADLLGITPRIASFLTVDDGFIRDLQRRNKRGVGPRRKGTGK